MEALDDLVIDQALFFMLVDDEVLEEDVAVSQLEAIVAVLRRLPHDEQRRFTRRISERIPGARTADEREGLEELLENLE